ncbi:TPA: chorismate mutase, partial [Vibrio cholerae]|nr:chorismate mutase [Vibrio cholerae]
MAVELNQLRDQIDEVDKQMVELLARRLALVEQVGQVKSRYG